MSTVVEPDHLHGIPNYLLLDLAEAVRDERLAWVPSQRWVLLIETVVSKARTLDGLLGTAAVTLMNNDLVTESAPVGFTVGNETYQAYLLEETDAGARLHRYVYMRVRRPGRQT
ncbi:hypothetical protein SAMN04488564_118154 [Lentzea waywayandensis]|uniref:Uncharacterized protein n=1 Tax=Lentzea waywayandensis TaxID=84724 RepID=A0A1I6FHD5_9PSEU|nr:hypothetical protein [Lentzea waywayandensis]SFR29353.1 hypothetical protein SAMN04488564_118154 [Lentzea waywayandensis]